MASVTVYMDKETKEKIRAAAKAKNISVSQKEFQNTPRISTFGQCLLRRILVLLRPLPTFLGQCN
jgi:hypothetical protein